MALHSSRTSLSIPARTLRQCRCSSYRTPSPSISPISCLTASTPVSRSFSSSTPSRSSNPEEPAESRPRWTHTPEGMRGPGFSINIVKDPRRKVWSVNEDPKRLDAMYNRLLGREGERLLPDDIKWLAVTHKSFDQGRRGFNTKLAYFGRQIMILESTLSVLAAPPPPADKRAEDPFGRQPFEHPALANVDKLSARPPQDLMRKERLARLAMDVGLPEVIRWKPRLPENLEGSGLEVVLNTTLFAIVGAISLQHGAEVAGRVAREKILRRLN